MIDAGCYIRRNRNFARCAPALQPARRCPEYPARSHGLPPVRCLQRHTPRRLPHTQGFPAESAGAPESGRIRCLSRIGAARPRRAAAPAHRKPARFWKPACRRARRRASRGCGVRAGAPDSPRWYGAHQSLRCCRAVKNRSSAWDGLLRGGCCVEITPCGCAPFGCEIGIPIIIRLPGLFNRAAQSIRAGRLHLSAPPGS